MASGIQNNTVNIQVDVVLTKTGRKYKSEGSVLGTPTKFALSDDGVDYNQYDTNLPDRGLKIVRTPMFDAWTNENNLLINKIISQPRDTQIISTFVVTGTPIVINVSSVKSGDKISTPVTIKSDTPVPSGFTLTIFDNTYVTLEKVKQNPSAISSNGDGQESLMYDLIGDVGVNSMSSVFYIDGTTSNSFEYTFDVVYGVGQTKRITSVAEKLTTLRVQSIDTGAFQDIPITIKLV